MIDLDNREEIIVQEKTTIFINLPTASIFH